MEDDTIREFVASITNRDDYKSPAMVPNEEMYVIIRPPELFDRCWPTLDVAKKKAAELIGEDDWIYILHVTTQRVLALDKEKKNA